MSHTDTDRLERICGIIRQLVPESKEPHAATAAQYRRRLDGSEEIRLRRDVIGLAAYELSQFILAADLTARQKKRLREINAPLIEASRGSVSEDAGR